MVDWGGKVAAWFAGVTAASAALAALIAATDKQPFHGWLRVAFIILVIIAGISFIVLLLTGLRAAWAAWRNRKAASRGPARRPQSGDARRVGEHSDIMRITIAEPSALVLNGTTRYRDLEQWLSHPVRPERRAGSPAFPVRGRVEPSPGGGQIQIRIYTDQWHAQDKMLIDENGDFSGVIYINKLKPQARLELTVRSAGGKELLQQFANLA